MNTEDSQLEYSSRLSGREPYNPNLGDLTEFIIENKGMVFDVAFKCLTKTKLPVELDDLRQEGYIGLIKAYQYFDPLKGAISTFAYYWIRNEMTKYIRDKLPLVRPPKRSYELSGKIIKNKMQDCGPEEIAAFFDTTYDAAQRALWRVQHGISVSINETIKLGGGRELEFLEMFFTEDDQSGMEVEQFLEILPKQQRRVIELMLIGYRKTDIAKELGVTRSRIGAVVRSVEMRYVKYRRRCGCAL